MHSAHPRVGQKAFFGPDSTAGLITAVDEFEVEVRSPVGTLSRMTHEQWKVACEPMRGGQSWRLARMFRRALDARATR